MSEFHFNPNCPLVNSQYTPIQVLMALDIWTAARKDLDAAIDALTGDFPDVLSRSNDQCAMSAKILNLTESASEVCPLNLHRTNIRRHSSERFPVDKTLKDAAQLRAVTKKVAALESELKS